jgi:hypothetical protein
MAYVQVSPVCDVRNRQSRPVHRRRRLHAGPKLVTLGLLALLQMMLLSRPCHAGTTVNGTTVNGTTVNGTTVNGTTVNGTTVNGTTVNGTTVNGTSVNGTTVNGTTVNGTTVNGITLAAYSVPRASSPYNRTKYGRLTGFKVDPGTGQHMAIQIRGFRGDVVDALVWTPELGRHQRMLPAFELMGMQWIESHCAAPGQCVPRKYRVIDGELDASRSTMPAHADNRDVWLFELQHTTAAEPAERDWQSFCQPDRHQRTHGMFLDGQWRADGSWDGHGYTFACTNGVLAKCARNWGYKPWKAVAAPGGERVSLQPLHQACTRAARADYCGDGVSHTRNGTMIDLFDRHGLNVPEQVAGFQAEAGFITGGASWVARPRWPRGDEDRGTRVRLATCERPRRAPPDGQDDALIYVWSRPRASAPSE